MSGTAASVEGDGGAGVMDREVTLIQPRKGWIGVDWREIVRYRELAFFLVWRDIKVRYKQTVLGVAWAVLQPLFMVTVYAVIFGELMGMGSRVPEFPYAVFVFAGLLPWQFFQSTVTQAGQSLINQQNLLTKIYFPRLFVPSATVGAGLVDMMISMTLYAGVLLIYQQSVSWAVIFVPGLVLLTLMTALGASYLLSALTVTYRDFRYVIPFALQAMMFLSPVIYPVTLVPSEYQWILALNPMAGIIEGYRWSILGQPIELLNFLISMVMALGLFTFGLFYFKKMERRFADIA